MRNGMMAKVPEKRRGYPAAIGLLVAVVVILFQPLPALAACVFRVTANTGWPFISVGAELIVGSCFVDASGTVLDVIDLEILQKLQIRLTEGSVALDSATGVVTVTTSTGTVRLEKVPPHVGRVTFVPTTIVGGAGATGEVQLQLPYPSNSLVVQLSDNSDAATVPADVTVAAGATTASFTVTTVPVTVRSIVTITATAGGVSTTALLTILPPVTLASVTAPTTIASGTRVTGQVGLSGPAPAGGLVVQLSDDADAATLPAFVTVAAERTTASFTITTVAVTADSPVTITATAGGGSKTALLTILPPAAVNLASVTLASTTIAGGAGVTGEVRLSAPAPSGGVVVTLSDNADAATLPDSVTVAAERTTTSFTVTTVPVTVFSQVTITATAGGVSRTAQLIVAPPAR